MPAPLSMVTIIAKNLTGVDKFLSQINVTVPLSGQLTLTEFASVIEIQSDPSLLAFIQNDEIIINDGTNDLSKTESINYVTPYVSKTRP